MRRATARSGSSRRSTPRRRRASALPRILLVWLPPPPPPPPPPRRGARTGRTRRRRSASALPRILLVWLAAASLSRAAAAEDEYGVEANSPDEYAVEEKSPLSLRALLDVRILRGGKAPSWMDRGPGKTRYGGIVEDGDFTRVTRWAVSQFALEPQAELPWGLLAHAQVNWEG